MTSMENDLRFMEHTEKIVADMLKSALASNGHNNGSSGVDIDETIEYVIIDETKSQNATNNGMNAGNSMLNTNENMLNGVEMGMNVEPEFSNFDYTNMSELESLISDGLNKIRLEYPMYPVSVDLHACNNCHNTPVSVIAAPSHMDNTFENRNIPYNGWYANSISTRNNANCSSTYQNEANRSVYGEEYWENTQYDGNNNFFDRPPSNGSLLSVRSTDADTSNTQISTNCLENIDASDMDDQDNDTLVSSSNVSNVMAEEATQNCIKIRNERMEMCIEQNGDNQATEAEMTHNVNGADSTVSTSTDALTSNHVQLNSANTPTAIHAAQSTTTTTTTAAAFGVLHQQTSCTTTNFVPNNLANIVLATNPAALYAQSILTSTAHQYLNVFRKEIQQYVTNSINYTGAPPLNLGFYERLLYAQLLQQQILQQQQQQAAIANLLQQQKIAIQNNAANVAAAAAAAAAANATYSNASVAAMTSNATGHVESTTAGNDGSYSSSSSFKSGMSKRTNHVVGNSNIVDMNEKKNFDGSVSAINDECKKTVFE